MSLRMRLTSLGTRSIAVSWARWTTRSRAGPGRTCHRAGWYSSATSGTIRAISLRSGRSMRLASSLPSTLLTMSPAETSRPVSVSQSTATISGARRGMMPCQPKGLMPRYWCGRNIILIATSLVA